MWCLQLQSIRISQRVNKLYGVVTRSEGWPDFRACSERWPPRILAVSSLGDECWGERAEHAGSRSARARTPALSEPSVRIRTSSPIMQQQSCGPASTLPLVSSSPASTSRPSTLPTTLQSWRTFDLTQSITKLTHVYNFATMLTKYYLVKIQCL